MYINYLHDVCIFVPMRLFGEKAAWVHQAHDTEQLNLLYMMIGIYVGIGMKSGATAMNLFRHSCEKFLLLIYHVFH